MMFDSVNERLFEFVLKYFETNDNLSRADFEKIITKGKTLIKRKEKLDSLKNALRGWAEDFKEHPDWLKKEIAQEEVKGTLNLYRFYRDTDIEELGKFIEETEKKFNDKLRRELNN